MSTRYQFIDDSGETRLAGMLLPTPAAFVRVTAAWDTPGITDDYVLLLALDPDTMVTSVRVFITEEWDSDGGKVHVSAANNGTDIFVAATPVGGVVFNAGDPPVPVLPSNTNTQSIGAVVIADGGLWVYLDLQGEPASTRGEIAIYALLDPSA